MDVTVIVHVATHRPPADHDFVCVTVAVDLPEDDGTIGGLNAAMWTAETRAKELACQMAMCHPHVVMPTRATIVQVTNI